MRFLATLFVFLTCLAIADTVKEDPLEREMLSIAHELRCAVCQNQPISESDAELARDMRQIIREQLAAGKSRDEIMDYFVARYGDYVLMKPRYRGPGAVIWLAPLLLFAVLAVSALLYLRHRRQASMPPAPSLSPEDAARVREAKQQLSE